MSSSIDFDSIPEETKTHPNWILWKLEVKKNKDGKTELDPKTGKPKKTKIPYQVNGKWAKTNNLETWSSFETVKETFLNSNGKYTGIGYVFDGKYRIIGIDYDDVFNPETGEWIDKEALEDIQYIASYAEYSQSRKGIHVLVKGDLPENPANAKKQGRRKNNREMYKGPQYFAFTGWKMKDAPTEIKENQDAINKLFKKYYPEKEQEERKSAAAANEHEKKLISPPLTDEEVLDKCRNDKRHKKFFKLYDLGEWKSFPEYTSQSEADLGLCVYLAFYTQNPEQVNSIFCKGKLYRPEWDRDSKGLATIKTAIAGLTNVWNPREYNNKKEKPAKLEKVVIHFDEVGDQIQNDNHIFSMRDNGQIYLYSDGVYKEKGTVAILGTQIRNKYKHMFIEKWKEINPDFDLPEHIPKATSKYVIEVLDYIRAYTHIDRSVIDANQNRYINFKNGLFDLEEWKLIDHTYEILSIAQMQARYDSTSTCPAINQYFKDCELPEKSKSVLEEFAGYCLTTDVRLQKAVMLYGTGANGKSVFINLLKTILGSDFVSGESLQNLETDKYRVANLYGKRLNAFPDLKDTPLQTNEVFNILTGNDLELIGEKKYQHDFSFKPTVKLLFSANKIPFAYSDNYAYYRRWILIEFPKTFENEEIDENILFKLTTEEEKSGFINLMLAGLKRLLKNRRFSYDLGVNEIEKQYLLHSDNVQIFEETCLRDCEDCEEPDEKKTIYQYYKDIWCKNNNITPVKTEIFSKKLVKLGRRGHQTTTYDITSKKRKWFSCYWNTKLVVKYRYRENV